MNNETSIEDGDRVLIGQPVEKTTYKDDSAYINKIAAFEAIPAEVWNFTMCGYQPLQKWLKDRRGIVLKEGDIIRFREMQDCIFKTIQIINEMNRDSVVHSIIP